MKCYENIIETNFHDNELPPEKCLCMTHIIILIDSAFKNSKHYYSQTFLEECKYGSKTKQQKDYLLEV